MAFLPLNPTSIKIDFSEFLWKISRSVIISLLNVQFSIQRYQIRGIWGHWVVLDHLRVRTTSNQAKNRSRIWFFAVRNCYSRKISSPPIKISLLAVQFPIQRYQTRGIWGRRVVLDHLRVPTTSNRTKNPSWTWFFVKNKMKSARNYENFKFFKHKIPI